VLRLKDFETSNKETKTLHSVNDYKLLANTFSKTVLRSTAQVNRWPYVARNNTGSIIQVVLLVASLLAPAHFAIRSGEAEE